LSFQSFTFFSFYSFTFLSFQSFTFSSIFLLSSGRIKIRMAILLNNLRINFSNLVFNFDFLFMSLKLC
jgi:hypothetical protein